ncbi:GMP synthase [glutamine-hydrolyzing] [Frankliniella fusca]|uniref:GMP synthase [glutamine-hydrolyzing] n=1 Tax=Frankliniella fusca TaxID=407009 RepID=A0AAE1L6V3_9NEOP|nr:GMP synthase [glutamine-hydrolyzing] [Frankliniella fusca]
MRALVLTAPLLALAAILLPADGAESSYKLSPNDIVTATVNLGPEDRWIEITLKDAAGKNFKSHIQVGGVYKDGKMAFSATSRCRDLGFSPDCLLHHDFHGDFDHLPKGEQRLLLQLRPGKLAVWRPENPVSVAKVPAPEGSDLVVISGVSQPATFTQGGDAAMDPEEPSTPPPVEPNA